MIKTLCKIFLFQEKEINHILSCKLNSNWSIDIFFYFSNPMFHYNIQFKNTPWCKNWFRNFCWMILGWLLFHFTKVDLHVKKDLKSNFLEKISIGRYLQLEMRFIYFSWNSKILHTVFIITNNLLHVCM